MKNNEADLNVAEKISAVIALHNAEHPGVPLSVSSLAKQAGVSRANLYVSHAYVIEKLRRPQSTKIDGDKERSSAKTIEDLKEELKVLKKTNRALLLLNGALRTKIRELNQRLIDAKPKRKT